MPYIGKSPVAGGFHKLDNLVASATATYALTLGGAAYYPESANQLLVSLNGVIQAPQDSFTVSGSNIVFDSALTASDSIDFIVALGDVIGVGSVTDGAITTAKLGNGAVTDAKIDTMAASKLTGALPAIDGSALTGISSASYAKVADVKAAGVDGGTATSGSWVHRTLNTVVYDPDSIVTVSGSQFTLGAGTYIVSWSAPHQAVDRGQSRLWNVTDSDYVHYGSSEYANSSTGTQNRSFGNYLFTITSTKTYRIEHQVQTTKSVNGWGVSADGAWAGNNEFTVVEIVKIG